MPTSPDPKRVLIVEDDPRLSSVWRDALEARGMRVVTEDGAEQGIAALRQEQFDVAIVDLMLRDDAGTLSREGSLTLLASIGLNAFRAPKVLAVSGFEEATEQYQAFRILTPANTLLKPVDPVELADRVTEMVAQRDREEEAAQLGRANQRWALQRFKFTSDHSQDAIYWIREDGTITYANEGACRMLGHPPHSLAGRTIEAVDPDYTPSEWNNHWRLMRQQRFAEAEAVHVGGQGQQVSVQSHSYYYNFEGDEFVVWAARNITDIKRYTKQLEQANQDLSDFTYIASHDLKAPIRAVDQIASWLEEDLAEVLPDASRENLRQLKQRSYRMQKLLNDLLAYSRAGRKREATAEVNLQELVDEAITLAVADSEFIVRSELKVNRIHSKATPLATILRNLISNAVKHHDNPPGEVVITCEQTEEHAPFLLFAVADDGPGIDPAMHEKAFAPFQTLRPRDEVEGSGIGLALVKRLVESEGGQVWIRDNGPKGAKISFTWK